MVMQAKIKDRLKNVEFFGGKEFSASIPEGRFVARQTAILRFRHRKLWPFPARWEAGRKRAGRGQKSATRRLYCGNTAAAFAAGEKKKRQGRKSRFTARFSLFLHFHALLCTKNVSLRNQ